jgi:hypothetical protein
MKPQRNMEELSNGVDDLINDRKKQGAKRLHAPFAIYLPTSEHHSCHYMEY